MRLWAQGNRDVRYWNCETRRELAWTAAAIPERRATGAADLVAVIQTAEKLMEENPYLSMCREGLATAYLRRGELLLLLGQQEPAVAELMKSLALSAITYEPQAMSGVQLVRGQTYLALGRAKTAAGKTDEATAQWKLALKIFEKALMTDPDNFFHRRGRNEAERALRPPAP